MEQNFNDNEMPSITCSTATTYYSGVNGTSTSNGGWTGMMLNPIDNWSYHPNTTQVGWDYQPCFGESRKYMDSIKQERAISKRSTIKLQPNFMGKRYVRVFVIDPDEKMPVDQSLLYKNTGAITDLTDEELYYDIDFKTLIKEHNETRAKIKQDENGKKVNLKPIRMRDLKVLILTVLEAKTN